MPWIHLYVTQRIAPIDSTNTSTMYVPMQELVFCSQKHAALGLSDIHSEIWAYLLHNQSYTEKINDQNNDDKAKKPTLGSHSISVNYCNIVYFRVTNNKFKAVLIVLSSQVT